jgi:translation initiation factor 3 subunit C
MQIFTGPPESVRDHIMAAARAMSRGDWEKAYTFITSLKMWVLMPERVAVQEMLMGKLKQEALRTYLFTYGSQYQALSSEQLCRMFQMDSKKVCHQSNDLDLCLNACVRACQPPRGIVMRSPQHLVTYRPPTSRCSRQQLCYVRECWPCSWDATSAARGQTG